MIPAEGVHILAGLGAWVLSGLLAWVVGDAFSPRPGRNWGRNGNH